MSHLSLKPLPTSPQQEERPIFFLNLSKCVSGTQCADLGGSFSVVWQRTDSQPERASSEKRVLKTQHGPPRRGISYNKYILNS